MRWTWLVLWIVVEGSARAAIGGTYQTPLGDMTITRKGSNVVAVAAGDGGPCGYKKGQPVLKGAVMDDSVTGKLTVCTEGCGVQEAFVVLLIARGGALLSGAVQLKNKACKLPLEGKGIALARVAGKKGKGAPVARAARVKGKQAPAAAPDKAPRGKQGATETPDAPVAAAAPATEAEVAAKFDDWNPDAATSGAPADRAEALRRGQEAYKLMEGGQFEAARPALMAALRADPGYAEGYTMMGATFYARDAYDDALDWYKKALTANPDFGDAYYNIACIYSVEGKKPLALKYLRIALLNGYTQAAAMEKDPDLDPLRAEPEYAEIMKLLEAPASAAPVPDGGTPAAVAPAPEDGGAPDAGRD
ncbi:MAG: hypothetical protein HY904_20210 [Deltaproteobacteria bacterium]|nr:hypothetical protein [Deltaproteobacteria bacterium]